MSPSPGARLIYRRLSLGLSSTRQCFSGKKTLRGTSHGDKWAFVMPNSYGYYNAASIIAICSGTTIVYPREAFKPQLIFSALLREKCTHVSDVPTMVVALCAVKKATGCELPHLKSILIGGAIASLLVLKQSIKELGADAVENTYGMTNGVFLTLGSQEDLNTYISGDDVAVSKDLPDSAVKLCL